jgi:hypothetical protein
MNKITRTDSGYRGDASQFFVAGELCRRGYIAVVTLGNCPNTDILCSDHHSKKFIHIQVKTYVPGNKTCSIGIKAEKDYGDNFIWIFGGIPLPDSKNEFEYYIIPSSELSKNIIESHSIWTKTLGKNDRPHDGSTKFRTLILPPYKHLNEWDISKYKNNWSIIEEKFN